MSSVRAAVDCDSKQSCLAQEALIEPVRDIGHSEIIHGHYQGTQPFEKGLGFPHRTANIRAWEDMRLRGQVRSLDFKKIDLTCVVTSGIKQLLCNDMMDEVDFIAKANQTNRSLKRI